MLSAPLLTTNLQLVPLLLRRFEIADVVLSRPQIHVFRAVDGSSNWTPFIKALTRTMKPGADDPVSFSEVRLEDGELNYLDEASQLSGTIGKIDLSLAWPAISRTFAATGQFEWRGERIDGSLSVTDFLAALSGERSGLRARIAGAPLKLAFDGAVVNRTNLMLEGTLSADSVSLRNALRWVGQEPPGTGGFGPFALKARANVVGPSVALTNVNIETRQERRRRRHHLHQQRPPGAAGDAGGRRARLHALSVDDPPARQRPARLEPAVVRSGLGDAGRCRHAAVRGQGDDRLLGAGPHRARRQSARQHAVAQRSAKRRSMAASPRDRSRSRAPTRWPTSRRSCNSPTSICRPAPAICSGSAA